MKKIISRLGVVLILAGSLTSAQSAKNCPSYNSTSTAIGDGLDLSQHSSGDHVFAGAATETCTYSSSGNPNCASTASVIPYVGTSDSGTLKTFPLGYHVSNSATNSGSQTSQDGGTQATGVGAAAWLWCLTRNCSVSVSANPLSFPPSSVWTHSQTASVVCPAEPDPTYVPGGGGGGGVGGDCTGCNCGAAIQQVCQGCCPSPIIVDTTGHGFHLTSAEGGVTFDIRGNDRPIKVAWTAADSGNAFLALDRNHNGKIDDGKELFGNFTEQPESDEPKNGYLALAEFDKPENGGNGDGIIDWHDAVFSKLLLWIDENHDGISQPKELHSLPELGVFSIGLRYRDERMSDEFGNGFRYRGVLNPNPLDGESKDGRWTYDVFFKVVSQKKPASAINAADHRLPVAVSEVERHLQ